MSRLTQRDKNGFLILPNDKLIRDTNILSKYTNKLAELEDIEEELGIELSVLFKAMKNGFYYIKDNAIKYCRWCVRVGSYLVEISPCCAVKEITLKSTYYGDDDEPFVKVEDAHYWSWKTSLNVRLQDYGKTWSLAKENLTREE